MYRKVMMMNSRRIQRAAIPSDVERRIVGQLEPDIRHLSHLIGRDLSDWLGESTD
jgi:hypothetical protein